MQISSALYTVCTSLRWRRSLLLFSFLNFVAENALCRATRPIPSPEKKGKEERDLSEQKESYRDKWAKKTKGRETNSRYIVSTPAPKWSTWFWLDLRKTRVASIHSYRHSPTHFRRTLARTRTREYHEHHGNSGWKDQREKPANCCALRESHLNQHISFDSDSGIKWIIAFFRDFF